MQLDYFKRSSFAGGLLSFLLLALIGSTPALGQGRIALDTRVSGVVDALVYEGSLLIRLSGADYSAQLYAGPNPDSLKAVGAVTTFGVGPEAGYVVPVVASVPGLPQGELAYAELRAWETSSGPTFEDGELSGVSGRSNTLRLRLGGEGGDNPPALLRGLTSFAIAAGFQVSFGSPATRETLLEGAAPASSCGLPVGTKLYLRVSAGDDGLMTISTPTTGVDAVLEAYWPYYLEGDDSSRLTCSDEPPGPAAEISFPVQANSSYWLTLASRNGTTGRVTLDYLLEGPLVDRIEILPPLQFVYDGTPHAVVVETVPSVGNVRVTYNGSINPPEHAGTYSVRARVEDPERSGLATSNLVIARAPQRIVDVRVPVSLAVGESSLLAATADSGLLVDFLIAPGSPARLEGRLLTATAGGTITLSLRQPGDRDYEPAPELTRTIAVRSGRPQLAARLTSPGQLQLTVTGNPGTRYAIEVSRSLASDPAGTEWTLVLAENADELGRLVRVIEVNSTTTARFFRCRSVPPS